VCPREWRTYRSHVADSPDKLYLPGRVDFEEAFRESAAAILRQASDPFVAHPFGLEGLEMAHRLLTAEVSDCQRRCSAGKLRASFRMPGALATTKPIHSATSS